MFKKLKETLKAVTHDADKNKTAENTIVETDKTSRIKDPVVSNTADTLDTSEKIPAREKTKKSKKSKTVEPDPKADTVMGKLLVNSIVPPNIGDTVEGPVINIDKAAVYIDLTPYGTGIIYGREYMAARDIVKKINIGDSIAAKVVDFAHREGYIELSLKEARQALIWSEAESAIKNHTILELPVTEANKGGLIIVWQGITGFLPASQLNADHYPRVTDGDKDKILEELRKFVGKKIAVSILSANPKEGKLIFTEKSPEFKERETMVKRYAVDDIVKGQITGIVDFGIFVKLEEGLEGLVHISEIDWSLVEDPRLLFKVGEIVDVKIIEIKDSKVSLSIKALKENPWTNASSKYKKDKTVEGVIIKFNKHGALAAVEEGIAGLVHVSEFGSEVTLRKTLELGKSYKFVITLFDPKEQKMALSYQMANKAESKI